MELVQATAELGAYHATPPQADGFYAIGDIRRLRGDLEGAEAALREAHARGRSPQPALALDPAGRGQGQGRGCRDQRRRRRGGLGSLGPGAAPAGAGRDRHRRRRRRSGPGPRLDELAEHRRGLPVAGARGRPPGGHRSRPRWPKATRPGAARELRAAIKGWREVGSPYEVARARVILSRALRALDDDETPTSSSSAALDEFRRLGARVDVEAAERELRDADGPPERSGIHPQDVHVHRHRRVDQPCRGARRRGVGAAPALARRHAAGPGREWGRGDRQLDRRRVLRGVRRGSRRRRLRDLDPARPASTTGPAPASRCRSGSASTRPMPTSAGATTAESASTLRLGSGRSPSAARSWPRPRPSPKRATFPPRTRGRRRSRAWQRLSASRRSPGRNA